MKRLRKLEGIVEELSGQIELETIRHPSSAGQDSPESGHMDVAVGHSPAGSGRENSSPSTSAAARGSPSQAAAGIASKASQGPPSRSPTDMSRKFGRLVLSEKGTSRYVSSGFWSKITDEVILRAAQNQLTFDILTLV
jgi:hypothetical protein